MKLRTDLPEIKKEDIVFPENGLPVCTVNGSSFLLKFPEKKGLFISDPVQEYLASHIACLIGLPVQETELFLVDGEIVCGCRSLIVDGWTVRSYADVFPKIWESEDVQKHGQFILSDDFKEMPENFPLRDRFLSFFWDTFVFDALIGNLDRTVVNIGFLRNGDFIKLCPLYDNEYTVFLGYEGKAERYQEFLKLSDEEQIEKAVFYASLPAVKLKEGIPDTCFHDLLFSGVYPGCREAVKRIVPLIDRKAIDHFIDGISILPEEEKEVIKKVLSVRKEILLDPACVLAVDGSFDNEARNRILTTLKNEKTEELVNKNIWDRRCFDEERDIMTDLY